MDLKWYVVYTKAGLEKKVSEVLTRKKIETYSPCTSTSKNWSDNRKVKETPLFKNFVFVRTTEPNLSELKKISGVVNLVYWMGAPVCIRNYEVKTMRLFLNEYSNVTIEKTAIRAGNLISVDGAEIEQEASLITIKNKKAYITLPSLGYTLSAEVETPNVRIISTDGVLERETLKSNSLFNRVSEFNNSLKNYWAKS